MRLKWFSGAKQHRLIKFNLQSHGEDTSLPQITVIYHGRSRWLYQGTDSATSPSERASPLNCCLLWRLWLCLSLLPTLASSARWAWPPTSATPSPQGSRSGISLTCLLLSVARPKPVLLSHYTLSPLALDLPPNDLAELGRPCLCQSPLKLASLSSSGVHHSTGLKMHTPGWPSQSHPFSEPLASFKQTLRPSVTMADSASTQRPAGVPSEEGRGGYGRFCCFLWL